MKTKLSIFLFALLVTGWVFANAGTSFVSKGSLQIHYGVFKPKDTPTVADIIFVHGYGDTFENHLPLFQEWNQIGLRVIAFDMPSHGKTHGDKSNDLDWHSFQDLADIAKLVRTVTVEEESRPLFLSGWSTGGLLAIRIVQSKSMSSLFPPIRGLVLFAPGVSVKKCVGNFVCQITNFSLSHNELLQDRPIHPKSPLYRINFAIKLLYNAHLSWNQAVPSSIPTLAFVAGNNEDKYVKSKGLRNWVQLQRAKFLAFIEAFQCAGARHELDNEPTAFGGPQVRALSVDFIDSILNSRPRQSIQGPCRAF